MFPQHPGLRAIAAYYLFYYGFLGIFSPFWGPYLRELGVSLALIGLMSALPQLNRIYAPALWGWLADRYRQRSVLLRLAGLGSLAGFVLLLGSEDVRVLFVAIFVASFFWSGALPQVEATTMALLGGDSGAYARLRIWGSLGFVIATLCGGYLVELSGVRILPVLVVVIMAGVALLSWYVPDVAPCAQARAQAAPLRTVLGQPAVMALLSSGLLVGAAHGLLMGFYSIHLEDHQVAKSLMGGLWSLGVVAEIALFWFMPQLSRRFALRQLYLLAIATAALRYLMIAWGAAALGVLLLAQLLHALTFAVHHAVSIAYVHRHFGAAHQTQGQALYIVFTFGIGGSLGTLLAGLGWASWGGQGMFSLAAAGCALAWLISWRWLNDASPKLSRVQSAPYSHDATRD